MLTTSLNARFVKDMKLPITIYKEPFFSERLKALDSVYDCVKYYKLFEEEVGSFNNPEDYFAEYNRVKDDAISFIKSTDGWLRFNAEPHEVLKAKNLGYRSKDIYTDMYRNKYFISVDIRKANFSVLRKYSPSIFGYAKTWEEFLSKFTTFKTIIDSKYIRQVVLGNCNPSRVISYEKLLMTQIAEKLTETIKFSVVFFSNDEIIFEISESDIKSFDTIKATVNCVSDEFEIPLRVECFKLLQLSNNLGFIKEDCSGENLKNKYTFKCLDGDFAHIIIKRMTNQEIINDDKCVYFKGFIAELKELPEFEIIKEDFK